MKKITIGLLLVSMLAFPSLLTAGEAGTTALNFLKMGGGARQAAMGDSGVAVTGDVHSARHNPATLTDLTQQELGFTHGMLLEGISQERLAYAHPFKRAGALGLEVQHVSYGTIEGYNRFNEKTSDIKATDSALTLTYAKPFRSGLGLGLNARYVQQNLSAVTANSYNFDLGVLYRVPGKEWYSNLDWGFAYRNLGPKPSYLRESHRLPAQWDMGVAFSPYQGKIASTFEAHKPTDEDLYFSFGVEVTARRLLSFRAGYRTGHDVMKGITVGTGLDLWQDRLQLDYTFIPFEEFSSVHRVGIIFRFGGPAMSSFKLGMKLMRENKFAEAILEFDKVLQRSPNHALAIRYMRKCAEQLRIYE